MLIKKHWAERRTWPTLKHSARTDYSADMTIPKAKKQGNSAAFQADVVQAAIDYGIDISMLSDNIKRTVAERIRRHQMALAAVERLRQARGNE